MQKFTVLFRQGYRIIECRIVDANEPYEALDVVTRQVWGAAGKPKSMPPSPWKRPDEILAQIIPH